MGQVRHGSATTTHAVRTIAERQGFVDSLVRAATNALQPTISLFGESMFRLYKFRPILRSRGKTHEPG